MSKKNKIRCRGEVGEQQFGIIPPREDIIILDQVQKEKLEKLDRALAGLKEKHREAIYYYFYKGMAYEEVRDLLGFQDVKCARNLIYKVVGKPVSYTHLRAHETDSYLVCRLLLEKKKK